MTIVNLIDSIESPATTGQPIPQAILDAQAIGAYSRGNSWPTIAPYAAARPDLAAIGWIVSIALAPSGQGALMPPGKVGRCGDFETGGIRNADVGLFMANADRTWGLPWLYTYASNGVALMTAAAARGFQRGRDYFYWSAHPGGGRHVCGPNAYGPGRGCGYPQADGTQWGLVTGNCDTSVINDYMLPSLAPPPPPPPTEALMLATTTNTDGRQEVFTVLQGGQVKHIWQESANGGWHGEPNVSPYVWANLGNVGGTPIGISAGSNQDGRLEVEVKLADGRVVHSWQTSPGGGWYGAQAGVTYATWQPLGNPGA